MRETTRIVVEERSRVGLAMALFAGGMALGWLGWSRLLHRSRRDLFHPSAVRRWQALGYLSGQTSIENARLLGDFVRWERIPRLRQRGEATLRRMELILQ